MASEVILSCESVRRAFADDDGHENVVLDDVNLQVRAGEFVVLIGPSGCGKSTLLNLMAGFSRPDAGRVLLRGEEVRKPGPDKAMVFQDYALLPWLDAKGNVEIGLQLQGMSKADRRSRAIEYLELVGLGHAVNRPVYKMSGGMQQRVAIARALSLQPDVLLMDEPFGALDALHRADMQRELRRICDQTRATVVFVTHSLDEAVFLADRVIAMSATAAGISGELEVDLPRPRDPLSVEFLEAERRLHGMLPEHVAAAAA